ncbi:MAG: hypothetical protein DI538_26380 [Azospira oryzae]|nr:MAG: hypothetical protein DI538_26380 [Azospira oryzae]
MGFNLYNQMDTHILSSHANASVDFFYKKGRYSTIVWIPANFLAEGVHCCGVDAMSYKPFQVHFHDIKKFNFNVVDGVDQGSVRGEYAGVFPGVIRPQLNWEEVQRIN